jgi:CheY-like chemotaxis protein
VLLVGSATAACDDFVLADRQRLKQILLNLLSNGIKYNREGGNLTVACAPAPADRLRIAVTDTGPGIPSDLRARLFMPFDRLGAERLGVEGTGLGLALSKRLVEMMGGQVGVETEEGVGSTFWVELEPAEAPLERQTRIEAAAGPMTTGTGRRGIILYIEDNPSNLKLVEHVLAQQGGVRLISAMQGRIGLELARKHRPDAILLDLHLPDLAGEVVLQQLQADPALARIPVVVLSADATPGRVTRLRSAGARAYLTKPLDVRQFLSLVDELLAAATTAI